MRRFLESGESHGIVLQDDVIVCRDFPQAVAEAISERPDSVLSLWVGQLRCKTTADYLRAITAHERWSPVFFRDIHHCVALVWPRPLAEAFLTWAGTSRLPGENRPRQSDDAIVGAWARRTKQTFWAIIPSIVEHNDEVNSTIGRPRGGAGRRAISFVEG